MVMPLQYKASRFWVIGMMRDTSAEDWRADVARHLAVVDCIEARDAQGARETMLEALGHFEEAERAPTPAAR
jgi:DNA-binding GntR family transcriptional regulator